MIIWFYQENIKIPSKMLTSGLEHWDQRRDLEDFFVDFVGDFFGFHDNFFYFLMIVTLGLEHWDRGRDCDNNSTLAGILQTGCDHFYQRFFLFDYNFYLIIIIIWLLFCFHWYDYDCFLLFQFAPGFDGRLPLHSQLPSSSWHQGLTSIKYQVPSIKVSPVSDCCAHISPFSSINYFHQLFLPLNFFFVTLLLYSWKLHWLELSSW